VRDANVAQSLFYARSLSVIDYPEPAFRSSAFLLNLALGFDICFSLTIPWHDL